MCQLANLWWFQKSGRNDAYFFAIQTQRDSWGKMLLEKITMYSATQRRHMLRIVIWKAFIFFPNDSRHVCGIANVIHVSNLLHFSWGLCHSFRGSALCHSSKGSAWALFKEPTGHSSLITVRYRAKRKLGFITCILYKPAHLGNFHGIIKWILFSP